MASIKAPKPHFREIVIPDGHPASLVVSALHKAIRRGEERLAAYLAKELDQAGIPGAAWNRIRNTISEDIGVAEAGVAAQVAALYSFYKHFGKADDATENKSPQRLFLIHAIMLVCRAKKSRMVDHLTILTYNGGEKHEIPDYAYDMHTAEGKKMGRGLDHFKSDGAKLENRADEDDPYEEEAYETLRRWLSSKSKNSQN